MEILKFKEHEPEKYWTPTKGNTSIAAQISGNLKYYDNYLVTVKRDGYWSRIIVAGENSIVQSRTKSRVTGTYGDNTEKVPHIVEELNKHFPNSVFLVEIAFEEINSLSKEVTTIMGCKPLKAVERQKNRKLQAFIFDCLYLKGESLEDKTYEERQTALSQLDFSSCNYINWLQPYEIEEFDKIYADIMSQGGEGVVLHLKSRKYQPGKRPARQSIKVKKAMTHLELIVKDTLNPSKLYVGDNLNNWTYFKDGEAVTKPYFYGHKVGVIVDNQGTDISVTSGVTDEMRALLSTDKYQTLIKEGKLKVIVGGMEIIEETNSIRHPYVEKFVITENL